jgi:membrane fusion protein, multidrug efflux system
MFKVIPTLYQAKLDAELAEAQLAQLEFKYTKKLHSFVFAWES